MSSRHYYCNVKKIRETMVKFIVEPFDDRVASSPRLLAGSRGQLSRGERLVLYHGVHIYVFHRGKVLLAFFALAGSCS